LEGRRPCVPGRSGGPEVMPRWRTLGLRLVIVEFLIVVAGWGSMWAKYILATQRLLSFLWSSDTADLNGRPARYRRKRTR